MRGNMRAISPVTRRWARFGPDDVHQLNHTPRAGVCISAFVIARRGRSILLGKPKAGDPWPEKGGYPKWRAMKLEEDGAWLLPATHLMMGEGPDKAAKRIARDWAGLNRTPKFVMIQSHLRPARTLSPKAKDNHWDICVIYTLRSDGRVKLKPWWSEMRFVTPSKIRKMNLGRGHGDILKEAGLL